MSSLQTVLIGVLLIALVKGQYDFDSGVPGNLEKDTYPDSYGNNEPSSNGNGEEAELAKRSVTEERFKQIYNRIQQNVANNPALAAELENELSSDDYSENGNNEIQGDDPFDENGVQGADAGNEYQLSDNMDGVKRDKRFFKKLGRKLKGFGRKVGHFGKQFVGNFIGGGGAGGAAGGGLGALGGGGGLGFLAKFLGR